MKSFESEKRQKAIWENKKQKQREEDERQAKESQEENEEMALDDFLYEATYHDDE